MLRTILSRFFFAGLILAALSAPARAANGATGGADGVALLRLVAAETGHAGQPFLAGIEMRLADGWKTYWRRPGDSGIAPRFDWSKSENVGAVEIGWPAPQRFDVPGDITFGYEHEVVWPLLVTPKDAAKPVTLALSMSYGVCREVCLPGEAGLWLTLPAASKPRPSAEGERIRAALRRVPVVEAAAKPAAISVRFEAEPSPRLLVDYGVEGAVPQLIVEGPDGFWFGTPETARSGGTVAYAVPVELEKGAVPHGASVTLTFSTPDMALEAKRRIP
ncbi:MAG: protein-disulfide reductase DsbD domain-containing protein [Parvibaculum sp.]|uniref:protein-disulfide reductase DsbD domain-containing protein n=1 Tax=Parvibaculum sp. TaxID=2024848 RepID=UPI003C762715